MVRLVNSNPFPIGFNFCEIYNFLFSWEKRILVEKHIWLNFLRPKFNAPHLLSSFSKIKYFGSNKVLLFLLLWFSKSDAEAAKHQNLFKKPMSLLTEGLGSENVLIALAPKCPGYILIIVKMLFAVIVIFRDNKVLQDWGKWAGRGAA